MNLPDLLFEAIVSNRPKVLAALLVEPGCDGARSLASDGRPLVIVSARYGSVETMQMILKAEPLVDAREQSGRTSLMIAAELDRTEIVKLLLANGASKALTDLRGWRALDWARHAASAEVERLLQ